MKIERVFFLVLLIFVGGIFLQRYLKKTTNTHDEIHYHAGFHLYNDGEMADFSDTEYMHVNPCYADEHRDESTKEEIQEEKAHLHDHIGDVAHVHQPGAVWRDLFYNIDYEIDKNVTGYINGEKVENILDRPIKEYDSVVFVAGDTGDLETKLQNTVTKDHIISVENKSESCGS